MLTAPGEKCEALEHLSDLAGLCVSKEGGVAVTADCLEHRCVASDELGGLKDNRRSRVMIRFRWIGLFVDIEEYRQLTMEAPSILCTKA